MLIKTWQVGLITNKLYRIGYGLPRNLLIYTVGIEIIHCIILFDLEISSIQLLIIPNTETKLTTQSLF